MKFRNLDSNDDWCFGQGKSSYVSGDIAIGLNIKTRILSWVGDCFFAMTAGIDWLNRLGAKNQRGILEMDLRRIILQSYGVVGLSSFNTVLNGRALTANYAVNTINGRVYQKSITQGVSNG